MFIRKMSLHCKDLNSNYGDLNCKSLKFTNTIYSKPLITLKNGESLCPLIHVGAYAAFESALEFCRENICKKSYDQNIAKATEDIIYKYLEKIRDENTINLLANLQYKERVTIGGKPQSISGECDIVIDMNDAVIFIELKIKSLTMLSSLGDLSHLLNDILKGWLNPLSQCAKHEIILRNNGIINFEENKKFIRHNDKEIFCISCTLGDHAFLHDSYLSIFVEQFLLSNIIFEINDTNPENIEGINKINKRWQEICGLIAELSQYRKGNRHILFNYSFLHILHLLEMINSCTSMTQFKEKLQKHNRISVSSGEDFWGKCNFIKKIKS
jgi:hypothetical protein